MIGLDLKAGQTAGVSEGTFLGARFSTTGKCANSIRSLYNYYSIHSIVASECTADVVFEGSTRPEML